MSDLYVARLVQYGIESGLIPEEERIYSTNQILEVMKKDDYEATDSEESRHRDRSGRYIGTSSG